MFGYHVIPWDDVSYLTPKFKCFIARTQYPVGKTSVLLKMQENFTKVINGKTQITDQGDGMLENTFEEK